MTASYRMLRIFNGQAADVSDIPVIPFEDFQVQVVDALADGARLAALTVLPGSADGAYTLLAVIACPRSSDLGLVACRISKTYPSLTPICPAAHWFEREIAEQWEIEPQGHPWLKPIRFLPKKENSSSHKHSEHPVTPGLTNFFHMDGDEVHEVAVGPVHAGVIEPGHFRFQCHGETVHHLEISLGYQHRGVEKAMAGAPPNRRIHYAETLAGDTTIGHTTAYVTALEALCGSISPARAWAIRGIAAELERVANHIGDLGALAGDVGFLPTMSYCGRLRGDALNLTAALCGNRFGRGLVIPGGVAYDVESDMLPSLFSRLEALEKDTTNAVELMFDTPSVLARFEHTGTVPEDLARRIGLVGVAARASGVPCDVRQEFPYGIYGFSQLPVCTCNSGDCYARAYVRWLEVRQSLTFIRDQLRSLPGGPIQKEMPPPAANRIAVMLVEGWRGEICHLVRTDHAGQPDWYKIIDPSFHNWFGLACALRGQQISDFPLCNKSFNLSYCGHDL